MQENKKGRFFIVYKVAPKRSHFDSLLTSLESV